MVHWIFQIKSNIKEDPMCIEAFLTVRQRDYRAQIVEVLKERMEKRHEDSILNKYLF